MRNPNTFSSLSLFFCLSRFCFTFAHHNQNKIEFLSISLCIQQFVVEDETCAVLCRCQSVATVTCDNKNHNSAHSLSFSLHPFIFRSKIVANITRCRVFACKTLCTTQLPPPRHSTLHTNIVSLSISSRRLFLDFISFSTRKPSGYCYHKWSSTPPHLRLYQERSTTPATDTCQDTCSCVHFVSFIFIFSSIRFGLFVEMFCFVRTINSLHDARMCLYIHSSGCLAFRDSGEHSLDKRINKHCAFTRHRLDGGRFIGIVIIIWTQYLDWQNK